VHSKRTPLKATLLLLLCSTLITGCAGGSLAKVGGTDELPKELSKELQDKFEIRDTSAIGSGDPAKFSTTALEAAPGNVTPVVKRAKGKKKKTAKAKAADAAATAAETKVVYPVRRPEKEPFWLGESHVFNITYFGMSGGDFTLDVLPFKAIDNRKVYHIRGTAISSPVFSLFYRLNDVVETFIDYEGLFSHRFHIVLDETKQTRDSLELYDNEKKQTFYWNRWNRKDHGYTETKEFAPIPQWSQDTMSALFYLRTVPLPQDAVITIPVVSEGKFWEAVVTVVRREMMDTPLGRVQTVVVRPEMKFQGILKKQGDSFIWLTDDDRRFVVRLEAKVRIGTIIAILKKIEPGTPPEP